MPINKESMPPPVIGKIGPYTVFVTPPATPKPTEPVAASPTKAVPVHQPPSAPVQAPPPVQPPPQQFHKPAAAWSPSNASMFGFFWDAVAKVQNAHSSLDENGSGRCKSKGYIQQNTKCVICLLGKIYVKQGHLSFDCLSGFNRDCLHHLEATVYLLC
ncbi:hypothetical protein F0562_009088 [Nyssa sinensis]|uniref:Uncharacterized protein n=1 Tax=Nyssa sinensis TaxID=561372 RepID=A0A5J4ZWL9_9ASTE|nr:hypothetical protein F0562_009088 [Nyssa sinensis]